MRPLYWRWSSSFALCEMWTTNTMFESKCVYHPLYSVWIWLYGVWTMLVFRCVEYLYARTSKVFLQLLIPSKVMRVNLKVTFGKPSVYEFLRICGLYIYTLPNFASCVKWLYVYTKRTCMNCAVELTLLVL